MFWPVILIKNALSNEGLRKLFPSVQNHCCNFLLHCFGAISEKLKLTKGLAMTDLFPGPLQSMLLIKVKWHTDVILHSVFLGV